MKFENLYIECENLEQRDEVADFVKRSGYSYVDSAHEDSTVAIYDDGRFQYLGSCKFSPSISYQEFMQKYGRSEMKGSIEKAMAELKIGREELSSALGMSRPYITKMLTRPQSEKTQAKVIGMIDKLIKSKNAVLIDESKQNEIDEFIRKTEEDIAIERGIANNNAKISLEKEKTIKDLNQALEYKDQLLAKYQDDLQKQTNQSSDYINDNLKLSEKIQELRSHNHSITSRKNSERMQFEKLTTELSNQVEILKRKNKDINICYSIVCVILTALVVRGFYV